MESNQVNPMCAALLAVKLLRLEVGNLFTAISEGVKEEHGEDGREFINEIQRIINIVHSRYRELEQTVNNIPHTVGNLSLQNSSYLTQESSTDKHALYSPLVRSHKWLEKVHKYSSLAHSILASNSLKKSFLLNFSVTKRKRPLTPSFFTSSPNWESLASNLDRHFSEMNVTLIKNFPTNIVLHITLGRVLQAMIAFKGAMIEWIVIKGYNESCNSSTDLMSESRYNVFRRITDHAHAATLHFSGLNMPEVAIRSSLNWLNSYSSLFLATCKQCLKHSYDCYPPTWRDFRTLEPYHFECKP